MKKIVALAAVLFASAASAGTFGAHVYTAHVDSKYCNTTPGVYYKADNGFTAGAYRNSECKNISAYAGYTFEAELVEGAVTAAVTVGAITGYKTSPVLPLVVPSVAVKVAKNTSVRMFFVPDAKGTFAGVSFGFEKAF